MYTVTGSVRLSILFAPATRAPMTGDRISLLGGMSLAMGNRTGSPYTENTMPTSSMSSLILLKRLRGSWMEAIITRLSSTSSVAGNHCTRSMTTAEFSPLTLSSTTRSVVLPSFLNARMLARVSNVSTRLWMDKITAYIK